MQERVAVFLSCGDPKHTDTHTYIDSMKFIKATKNLSYHFVCSNFTPLAIVSVNILLNIEAKVFFCFDNYLKVLNQLLSNYHLWKINKLAKFNQPKQYNNYKHSESKQESHETFRYKMVKYMTKSIQQQLHTYYKIIKSSALSMWGGANWLERKKNKRKLKKWNRKYIKRLYCYIIMIIIITHY